MYDFLAIGEKLKLKGLAKTPEHSASQVDIKIWSKSPKLPFDMFRYHIISLDINFN